MDRLSEVGNFPASQQIPPLFFIPLLPSAQEETLKK